jgi:hypothetical protein
MSNLWCAQCHWYSLFSAYFGFPLSVTIPLACRFIHVSSEGRHWVYWRPEFSRHIISPQLNKINGDTLDKYLVFLEWNYSLHSCYEKKWLSLLKYHIWMEVSGTSLEDVTVWMLLQSERVKCMENVYYVDHDFHGKESWGYWRSG